MKVRELDSHHDWTFGRGLSNYLTESDAIAQCVKTKLLSFKKDWFLNRDDGIAWFDYLAKNPDTRQLENEVKTAIFNVDGVVTIDEFDILFNAEIRQFLIQITYTDRYNKTNEVTFNVTDNK